jgi:hypothetical protein
MCKLIVRDLGICKYWWWDWKECERIHDRKIMEAYLEKEENKK